MEEILQQLIDSLSRYYQGFIYPRWSRISSINSITWLNNPWFPLRSHRIKTSTMCTMLHAPFQSSNGNQGKKKKKHPQAISQILPFPTKVFLQFFCWGAPTNSCLVSKLFCYPHLRGSKHIAGHFCAPESVRLPSEREEHQGEISFSKAYPCSHNHGKWPSCC